MPKGGGGGNLNLIKKDRYKKGAKKGGRTAGKRSSSRSSSRSSRTKR